MDNDRRVRIILVIHGHDVIVPKEPVRLLREKDEDVFPR